MLHIERVLVPVDFSPCSARALELASYLSARFGSLVHALHVIDQPPPAELTRLQQNFAAILPPMPPAVAERMHARVMFGDPADRILEVAKERFDLILIGQRGRSARAIGTGSVAAAIEKRANCAVVMVDADCSLRETKSSPRWHAESQRRQSGLRLREAL